MDAGVLHRLPPRYSRQDTGISSPQRHAISKLKVDSNLKWPLQQPTHLPNLKKKKEEEKKASSHTVLGAKTHTRKNNTERTGRQEAFEKERKRNGDRREETEGKSVRTD